MPGWKRTVCRSRNIGCSELAQFDVHADPIGGGLWLDCRTDMLSHLNTRLVVPLMLPELAPKPAGRLNPAFHLDGERRLMITQYAAAVETKRLGPVVASLTEHGREIIGALDVLLTGV